MKIILIVIIGMLFIHYLGFILTIFSGIKKLIKKNKLFVNKQFVTIIIPFKNESDNIIANYESLQKLDYNRDKFEIIYVDDSSDDDSLAKLTNAIDKDNVRVITADSANHESGHKKRAIQNAVDQSRGEIIVLSDADCIYKSSWLKCITEMFDENTGAVAGPVIYESGGNFFDNIQLLEFAGIHLASIGLIGAGKPVTCSSANLAFRKSVFKSVGGYSENLNLSSGDDELLIQKIAKETKYKIDFCWNKDAVVTTSTNKSIGNFLNQRTRWASKTLYYKNNLLILSLIIIYLFYLSFIPQLIIGIFWEQIFLTSFAVTFIGKLIFDFLVMRKGLLLIYSKNNLNFFLAAELFQIPYIVYAGIRGLFGRFEWKGRELNR